VIDDLKKNLENQRILIICPKFFGYESRIIKKLEELGSMAVWLDDRPSNSVLIKLIVRYFPFLYKRYINNYYKKNINDFFTQILVISAESLSYENICYLREKTKANKLILYMYDSLKNKKRLLPVIEFFDKCLTFDPDDAKKYNFIFRPLFFTSGLDGNELISGKYNISFIGTGHSDRAMIVEAIKSQCKILGLSYFIYLYLQSPLIYYFYKMLNGKKFKKIQKEYFYYRPLEYNEYVAISECSDVILDIEHPKQKGLTMRTLEMLGKNKKIITTNKNIAEYDFYKSTNICIIDRNNPVINKNFFENKYEKLPARLYYKYSIYGWLEEIFL
jgi:hypothetical protein